MLLITLYHYVIMCVQLFYVHAGVSLVFSYSVIMGGATGGVGVTMSPHLWDQGGTRGYNENDPNEVRTLATKRSIR